MAPKDVSKQIRKLSDREREVRRLRCQAFVIAECSRRLYLADSTIKTYIGRIYLKFGLDQFTELQRWRALFQVYCPALGNEDFPPSPPEARGPESIPDLVMRQVEDDEAVLQRLGGDGLSAVLDEISKVQ